MTVDDLRDRLAGLDGYLPVRVMTEEYMQGDFRVREFLGWVTIDCTDSGSS